MIGFIIRACLPRRRYYRRSCGYRSPPPPQEPIGLVLGLGLALGVLFAGMVLHLPLQLTVMIAFGASGVVALGVLLRRYGPRIYRRYGRRKPPPAPPRRPPPPEPPRPQAYYSNRR